jgi:hypothetical protein
MKDRMDNQSSSSRIFLAKHAHGICLRHKPDWENVGSLYFEPNPHYSGATHDATMICCDTWMKSFKEIQKKCCKICGREQDVVCRRLVICEICGKEKIPEQVPYVVRTTIFGGIANWD